MAPPAPGPDGEFLEVACKSLHPRGCQARIRGATMEALLAAAIEHGASGHGYTPAFYDANRRESMRAALEHSAIRA